MGDLPGHAKALAAELRKFRYGAPVSWELLLMGETTVFLPILHHTLLLYSQEIASEIMKKGYRLYSCTDQRFVESVFKLVRREFQQKPVLTVEQFLRKGFAEHKIIFLLNIMKHCREWDEQIKNSTKKSRKSIGSNLAAKERIKNKIIEKSKSRKKHLSTESIAKPTVQQRSVFTVTSDSSFFKLGEDENADLGNTKNVNQREDVISFERQIEHLQNVLVLNINQINENVKQLTDSVHNRLLNLENRVGKLEKLAASTS